MEVPAEQHQNNSCQKALCDRCPVQFGNQFPNGKKMRLGTDLFHTTMFLDKVPLCKRLDIPRHLTRGPHGLWKRELTVWPLLHGRPPHTTTSSPDRLVDPQKGERLQNAFPSLPARNLPKLFEDVKQVSDVQFLTLAVKFFGPFLAASLLHWRRLTAENRPSTPK